VSRAKMYLRLIRFELGPVVNYTTQSYCALWTRQLLIGVLIMCTGSLLAFPFLDHDTLEEFLLTRGPADASRETNAGKDRRRIANPAHKMFNFPERNISFIPLCALTKIENIAVSLWYNYYLTNTLLKIIQTNNMHIKLHCTSEPILKHRGIYKAKGNSSKGTEMTRRWDFSASHRPHRVEASRVYDNVQFEGNNNGNNPARRISPICPKGKG
jgi:hypothetical protein